MEQIYASFYSIADKRLKKFIDPCTWPLTLKSLQRGQPLRFPKKLVPSKFGLSRTKWNNVIPVFKALDLDSLCHIWTDSSKRSLTPVADLWSWSDLQHDQKLRFLKKLVPSMFGQNRTRWSKVMPVFKALRTDGRKADPWPWAPLHESCERTKVLKIKRNEFQPITIEHKGLTFDSQGSIITFNVLCISH